MTGETDTLLYLSSKDVLTACENIDAVATIRTVLAQHARKETILPDEAYLLWTNQQAEAVRSLNMPAFVGGSKPVAGTKIINGNPHNVKHGWPRASGLTMLFNVMSGRIMCIMEGAHISALRTASVTAVAAELLAGETIENLAIIGAGQLAIAHLNVLSARLPKLRTVRIFDLDQNRAAALLAYTQQLLASCAVHVSIASTAEQAIREAELIVPVTTTTTGYIMPGWLKPGALLINVSLDDPLPDVVFQADKVIVDDWNLVKNDKRRLIGRLYRQGLIAGPDQDTDMATHPQKSVYAELGEIVAGMKPGREKSDKLIMVNPFGMAIEDVALAAQVYEEAQRLGLGTVLER